MSDEQFMQRAMELADNYANANALAELEDTSGDDLSPAEREAETARTELEEHLRAGIVPRTPTSAMLAAGQAAWLRDPMRRSTTLWEAMYAAAALPVHPQPKPSEADAKAWGLTLLNRAQAQVEASEQACADAFDNTFHKIKAEVSRDWWNRIWQMACEWQRHYTIRNKTTAQPQPSADRQEGNQQ